MRLLLDTAVWLWWRADDPALGAAARSAIADPRNDVYVSAASIWEIAVKRALGKLHAPHDQAAAIPALGFRELAMNARHAERAGSLPPHHRDHFDRMLAAQAQLEGLTLVTSDAHLRRYRIDTLDARSA